MPYAKEEESTVHFVNKFKHTFMIFGTIHRDTPFHENNKKGKKCLELGRRLQEYVDKTGGRFRHFYD